MIDFSPKIIDEALKRKSIASSVEDLDYDDDILKLTHGKIS